MAAVSTPAGNNRAAPAGLEQWRGKGPIPAGDANEAVNSETGYYPCGNDRSAVEEPRRYVQEGSMPKENAIYIRQGKESDLEAIARVLVDTWQTTFRGLLSDEFLDGLTYKHQEERHLRTMTSPRTACFVATSAQTNEVVGFVNGGPNRDSEFPYSGELYALYIREKFQRCGIGKRLFCALAGQFLELGLTSMLVWVLVNNPNRRFYEKIGGRFAAERLIELGPDTVNEIALVWSDLGWTFCSECRLMSLTN